MPAAVPPAVAVEYWLDGEPVRALVADAGSLRSPAGTGPWAAGIRQLVDARRWSVPGAYLLLWDALTDGRVPVYVGSTKDLLERLHDHEQVGWGLAIVLTGHGLRRSAAWQIERALGRALLLADPSETAWSRRWDRLPGRDPNEIPWPYVTPLILAAAADENSFAATSDVRSQQSCGGMSSAVEFSFAGYGPEPSIGLVVKVDDRRLLSRTARLMRAPRF